VETTWTPPIGLRLVPYFNRLDGPMSLAAYRRFNRAIHARELEALLLARAAALSRGFLATRLLLRRHDWLRFEKSHGSAFKSRSKTLAQPSVRVRHSDHLVAKLRSEV